MRIKFILFLFLFSSTVRSQTIVEGKVIDASDKQPLAFVNIGVPGMSINTSTNIDGKFIISSDQPFSEIVFTYVGYETFKFPVWKNERNVIIKLKKKSIDLSEVEVKPGVNPAHRIIKLASENRDKNNPDKIRSYVCNTYSKAYYDLVYNTDELNDKKDSIKADSLKSKFRIYTENCHVLMMESVSERKFLAPNSLKETVVATKVSGFKDPSFSTSITDLQPFSFYDDYFKILGKDYLNPISGGSTSKYFFNLEDTLFQGKDSVFIISYHPLKGKNFDGLEGVLYINSNQYAIQNVIASPSDQNLVGIKIQQQYSFVGGKQWFPEQLNYELHYKKYPTKYVGMRLTGKGYITNVILDTVLRKKEFDEAVIVMDDNATRKDDTYWRLNRLDSLDAKEKKTYKVIDSLGKKEHFERTLRVFEALLTLQIPVGPISVDLDKILSFNEYEIARGGIGLHTNKRLSRWFTVGGYVGYGYHDSIMKFGGDAKIFFKKNSNDYFLKFSYIDDLSEPGRAQYYYPKPNYNRNRMATRMEWIRQQEVSVNFRAFHYLTANAAMDQSIRIPKYDYLFLPDRKDSTAVSAEFKTTEFTFKGRYAYKEQLVQALGQMISDGSKFPVIYFAYTKGFKTSGYGNYEYNRISLGIERSFLIKNFGKTHAMLEGGYLQGNVPYAFLFNGNGSYADKKYIYVENTFQTMGIYEFVSDKYVDLFLSHDFGSLLFKRPKFQPRLQIFTNIGFGSLSHPEQQRNLNFKTMEKGFYESGLMINNVLRVNYYNICYLGLGGGAFIRYGAYASPKTENDLAYKISLTLSF